MRDRAEKRAFDSISERHLMRELRGLRTALRHLTEQNLLFINQIDTTIGTDPTMPPGVGRKLAAFCNDLEMKTDQVRFSKLGVDFRDDDKPALIKRLRAGRGVKLP